MTAEQIAALQNILADAIFHGDTLDPVTVRRLREIVQPEDRMAHREAVLESRDRFEAEKRRRGELELPPYDAGMEP